MNVVWWKVESGVVYVMRSNEVSVEVVVVG